MNRSNRQLILRERPSGKVGSQHFSLIQTAVPELRSGEVLVRVVWLGIDPTQRTWLNPSETYISPVAVGEVMRGNGVGQIVESKSERFVVGEWVLGVTGWQDYLVTNVESPFALTKIPDNVDPKAMLGILGVNGLTAYFGLSEIGQPSAGDTVFVSAAAGSTGSTAGQIAKIRGCRVIGSAGGSRKCDWVTSVAGFDECIDYKRENVSDKLRLLAPNGINVMFDNVGGEILEAGLDNLALGARIVLCGSIASGYREGAYGLGPRNYMQLAFRRASMEGYIFFDYISQFPIAFDEISQWLAEGRIAFSEYILEGLERAPAALQGLFEGDNIGKQLIKM